MTLTEHVDTTHQRIADSRHCFIEATIIAADDPDRSWR